ncbi:MAG TPA: cupin domain-containing protein [Gaiellaceae bacterium]|nr:cupin domain-containing protein [Gaiellaceae bacterium]
MGALEDLAGIRPLQVWDGVRARSVDGERLNLAVIELDPDSVVPEHSHENEQLGMVLSGSVSFRVGDEVRDLAPGGTWRIAPNVPHEVRVGAEGAARRLMAQQLAENRLRGLETAEYRVSSECREGGRLDLDPASDAFP